MRTMRWLGLAATGFLVAGLVLGDDHAALYADQDPTWRPMAALLVTAACWLVALALAGVATVKSIHPDAPRDPLTILLARGPAVALFVAFAVRLFLFAMKND